MQPLSPEQARELLDALTTMLVGYAPRYLVPGKGVDMTALLDVIRQTLEHHTAKPGTQVWVSPAGPVMKIEQAEPASEELPSEQDAKCERRAY